MKEEAMTVNFLGTYRRMAALIAAILVLCVGIFLANAYRNRLSSTNVLGQWNGYWLQGTNTVGVEKRLPSQLTFQPDGKMALGSRIDASYLVCQNVLVLYSFRRKSPPPHPIGYSASIVGDTLTIDDPGIPGKPLGVFKRVQ